MEDQIALENNDINIDKVVNGMVSNNQVDNA